MARQARHGKVWLVLARHVQAGQGRRGWARQDMDRPGLTRRGKARQARRVQAGPGGVRLVSVRPGEARQGKAEYKGSPSAVMSEGGLPYHGTTTNN